MHLSSTKTSVRKVEPSSTYFQKPVSRIHLILLQILHDDFETPSSFYEIAKTVRLQ